MFRNYNSLKLTGADDATPLCRHALQIADFLAIPAIATIGEDHGGGIVALHTGTKRAIDV